MVTILGTIAKHATATRLLPPEMIIGIGHTYLFISQFTAIVTVLTTKFVKIQPFIGRICQKYVAIKFLCIVAFYVS